MNSVANCPPHSIERCSPQDTKTNGSDESTKSLSAKKLTRTQKRKNCFSLPQNSVRVLHRHSVGIGTFLSRAVLQASSAEAEEATTAEKTSRCGPLDERRMAFIKRRRRLRQTLRSTVFIRSRGDLLPIRQGRDDDSRIVCRRLPRTPRTADLGSQQIDSHTSCESQSVTANTAADFQAAVS